MTELVYLDCALLCDQGFTITFRRNETIEITCGESEIYVLRNCDMKVLRYSSAEFSAEVVRRLSASIDYAADKLEKRAVPQPNK